MKKKDSKNYLDFIPEKNPEIEYETGEDGIITVLIEWKGFYHNSRKRQGNKHLCWRHEVSIRGWNGDDGQRVPQGNNRIPGLCGTILHDPPEIVRT